MSGMGASLLPVPPMPPKKGLVGKVKSDPKKLRMGGGKVWEDTSLDDWDPSEWVGEYSTRAYRKVYCCNVRILYYV